MKQEKNISRLSAIGWIIVIIGGLILLYNMSNSTTAEYITQQTYYAVKINRNILFMIFGSILVLFGKQ